MKYEDIIFSLAGWDSNKDETFTTWIFSVREGMKYIGDGPYMNYGRRSHGCGIYQSANHDGRPLLVVAGSYCCGDAGITSEYWDFTVPGSKWTLTCKSNDFISFSSSFYVIIKMCISFGTILHDVIQNVYRLKRKAFLTRNFY